MYGIYIHVPFCLRKCPYCDFYSVPGPGDLREAYLDALSCQIRSFRGADADTVYFGGGTPSLLEPRDIASVIRLLREQFRITRDAEITMECNPATADTGRFRGFLEAGVNRVSIGCQSFCEKTLKPLGRLHTAEDAAGAIRDARAAGFRNISADIMLGIPYEDPVTAARDAETAAGLGLQHISAYLLRICEGTPFAEGVPGIPDDDVQAECYRSFCSVMDRAGYLQYEISNFSLPGFESRHNLKYWNCGDWLGFGPAAHMSSGGERYSFPADLDRYIRTFQQPLSDPLPVMTHEGIADAEEYIITSLRTAAGLDLGVLQHRFGHRLSDSDTEFLSRCEAAGLAVTGDGTVRLTREGFLVSNSIISELI